MNNQTTASPESHLTITRHQHFFVRYFSFILIDLTVLNLFDEYWDMVSIESFSISLLTAILLQILLKLTLAIEHRISEYFALKSQVFFMKFLKILSLWVVLFGSKLVILWVIDLAFGEEVLFLGPYHGVISFIVVVVVMLIAEALIVRVSKRLGI